MCLDLQRVGDDYKNRILSELMHIGRVSSVRSPSIIQNQSMKQLYQAALSYWYTLQYYDLLDQAS